MPRAVSISIVNNNVNEKIVHSSESALNERFYID